MKRKILISVLVICIITISAIGIKNKIINVEDENSTISENNLNTNIINDEIENNIEKEYLEEYEIAGYIQIPKTNIDIPVLLESTVSSLDLSVAIMHGDGLNAVGNTTIMGIDFFKDNNKLEIGDTINIIDQAKNEVVYEVYDIQKLNSKDTSYFERDTKGEREITLVTYNDDDIYNRLVIFAKQK